MSRSLSLSKRLPEGVFDRIHQDIGQATMAWVETPRGLFDSEQAAKIAFDLCHHVADLLDTTRQEGRRAALQEVLGMIQGYEAMQEGCQPCDTFLLCMRDSIAAKLKEA